ncbi:hypothetical protein AVEN_48575-1, partial [Araneus ventricosus]
RETILGPGAQREAKPCSRCTSLLLGSDVLDSSGFNAGKVEDGCRKNLNTDDKTSEMK